MHISKLSVVNYRNFRNTSLYFNKGVNTIIGENGAGKTNVFTAMRLMLDENLIRSAYRLDETDFHRGLGKWQGHWIILSLEFDEISQDESSQSLFLHGTGNLVTDGPIAKATYNLIFRPNKSIRLKLSQLTAGDHEGLERIQAGITIADYETIFTGKSEADFNHVEFYKQVVGDFHQAIFPEELEFPSVGLPLPRVLSISKEISFTFIQALRNVVADFQDNRKNPLLTLLKSKSGTMDRDVFAPISDRVNELNELIAKLPDVHTLNVEIADTIKEAVGETYSPTSLSIKSDLSNEADRLFQSLKLYVGESEENYEGTIHELSLGGANLIYLTLKLLEFKYQRARQSFANFLIIEEPEAHIHTHIQKTLFDKLNFTETQIIYSTHSTHISEVSNVKNINILGKRSNFCEAYQPATNLTSTEIGNIQRYLDAVRSTLLFAKSVILVEGDAEEILIPILIKKVLGVSIDELGISLINIRSTGFQNVAVLFHDTRIRKRCSIITDHDSSIVDTTPVPGEPDREKNYKARCKASQEKGEARKAKLEEFARSNEWVKPFFAPNTFEVNLISVGNIAYVTSIVDEIYKDQATIEEAKRDLGSRNISEYGRRVLRMANQEGKGWFAILLGKKIDHEAIIPDYILNAVVFATQSITNESWFNILSYRIRCIQDVELHAPEVLAGFKVQLDLFRTGDLDFNGIRQTIRTTFGADKINRILQLY